MLLLLLQLMSLEDSYLLRIQSILPCIITVFLLLSFIYSFIYLFKYFMWIVQFVRFRRRIVILQIYKFLFSFKSSNLVVLVVHVQSTKTKFLSRGCNAKIIDDACFHFIYIVRLQNINKTVHWYFFLLWLL